MYRAVTYYFLKHSIDITDPDQIMQALDSITIDFEPAPKQSKTILNGQDISAYIYQPEVANFVSEISTISAIRKAMVSKQHLLGVSKALVMDGRDIGSVVFPRAELKIFLTANIETRIKRRFDELVAKGVSISMEAVEDNLRHRDHLDSTRKDSPLIRVSDAVFLDNSNLNRSEQLAMVHALAKERMCSVRE